jgi:hypothetical protein
METRKILWHNPLGSPLIFVIVMLLFGCTDDPSISPVLTTIQAADADITSTTARLKGEIQILGNQDIREYGIELSKSMIFSSPNRKTVSLPFALGQFELDFTGLDPATMYYYRAYVLINTAHIYSKNALHFTTKQVK